MSHFGNETIRPRLRAYAEELRDQVHGSFLLFDPDSGETEILRVQFAAWAAFTAWRSAGEPVAVLDFQRMTARLLSPPVSGFPVITTPLKREALACELAAPDMWVLLARHTAVPGVVPVTGEVSGMYTEPMLTYVAHLFGKTTAGYFPVTRSTTFGDLQLAPGRFRDPVTEQEKMPDPDEKEFLALRLQVALTEFLAASYNP